MYIDVNKYNVFKKFEERENLVGFIASMDKRKGILQFAISIKQLCELREDLRFVIVGSGPLQKEVRKLLNNLVVQNRVHINQKITEKCFPYLLNELKLYVLPSIAEGLPNTILEAMACGTAVLATPVGAIPDIIRDGQNGFSMENNSPESIARGILRALNYPKLPEVTREARALIEREYSYEATAYRCKKILTTLTCVHLFISY